VNQIVAINNTVKNSHLMLCVYFSNASQHEKRGRKVDSIKFSGYPSTPVNQWLNYLSRGVGALPIQWPMVKIRQFQCHSKSRLCTHVK